MPPQGQQEDPDFIPAKQDQPDFIPATSPPAAPEESTSSKAWGALGDVATGVGKGLLKTGTALSPLINKIPYVGEALAPKQGISAAQGMATPTNTAQKVGKYGEQAAEFLIPGLGEEGAGAKVAEAIPSLGKYAAPLGRMAYNAATSGAMNKLQGGSFGAGAATGGAMGAVGEGAKALAPSLAEGALGITKKMRGFGKTPGRAALDETTAFTPGGVAQQADTRIGKLVGDLEHGASTSPNQASTIPALNIISREKDKAIAQNSKSKWQMLDDLEGQLTKEFQTGKPIPQNVPAWKALDLKRGVGDLDSTWNPEQRIGMKPTVRSVYGALDKELDNAVPGADKLNQRISSLIPVSQRGKSEELGAGIGQRVGHRLAAHTGALAGSGIGAGLGYEHGGSKGALAGGALGLVIPEILSSPTVQMAGARALNSTTIPQVGTGLADQLLPRKKSKPSDNPEDE